MYTKYINIRTKFILNSSLILTLREDLRITWFFLDDFIHLWSLTQISSNPNWEGLLKDSNDTKDLWLWPLEHRNPDCKSLFMINKESDKELYEETTDILSVWSFLLFI